MTCSDSIIGFLKDYIEPLLQEVVPNGIGIIINHLIAHMLL